MPRSRRWAGRRSWRWARPLMLVVISPTALIKRGCDRRDLRFPARRGPRHRNDHFSARRYSLRRLRPPALSVPASLGGSFPPRPARARPALRHPLCALRTTVPPPNTRAGVVPSAPVRARAYPPTAALVTGTPLAVALVGGTPLAVAHAIPPALTCAVITRTEVVRAEVAGAGAFSRPSRAPRILADPNRPAVLARAH